MEVTPQAMARDREQARLSREIDDLERRYRNLPPDQAAPVGMAGELEQAILKQQQLWPPVSAAASSQQWQLERLLVIRDTDIVRRQWARVMAWEAVLAQNPALPAKVKAMEELRRLRRAINRSRAPARYKDLVREAQLERELAVVQAKPLRMEADVLIGQASEATARKNWASALELYTRARELLEQINRRFPQSPQADLGLEARLKSEENSLQGADVAAEIDGLMQGGDAMAVDQPETAAGNYQQAMRLQGWLNERWPQSRFFSTQRLATLEEKRQTVLSAALIEKMKEADRVGTRALAGRQLLVAGQQIDLVLSLARQLGERYARTRLTDGGLARKNTYLKSLGGNIRSIQDDLYGHLLPLPGEPALMLMQGEVPQSLYTRVIKFNPSRTPGGTLAVESLAWPEAQEFCRRLGWIMGRVVRVPSRREMLKAWADTVKSQRSTTQSARASFRGFTGLQDSVSEWLETADTATEAWVMVGPTGPKLDGSTGGPFVPMPKDTRSRDLGFRVIVELSVPE